MWPTIPDSQKQTMMKYTFIVANEPGLLTLVYIAGSGNIATLVNVERFRHNANIHPANQFAWIVQEASNAKSPNATDVSLKRLTPESQELQALRNMCKRHKIKGDITHLLGQVNLASMFSDLNAAYHAALDGALTLLLEQKVALELQKALSGDASPRRLGNHEGME